MDNRKQLYKSVIISGANTMFPGFSSRLESELRTLYKQRVLKDDNAQIKIEINIIDNPRRNFSVFCGAAFLANFYQDKEDYWISKQEWEECGDKILYQKCQNMMI